MEGEVKIKAKSWKEDVLAKANVEASNDSNVDAFQSLLIRELKSDITKAVRKLDVGGETYTNKVVELDEELSELNEERTEILTTINFRSITTIEARKAYKGTFLAAIDAIDAKIAAKTAEKSTIESAYNTEVAVIKAIIAKKQALVEVFQ